jgi:hypothetical protein
MAPERAAEPGVDLGRVDQPQECCARMNRRNDHRRADHLAHVGVQQDIGGAGRHRPPRGADDARQRRVGLHHVRFEILIAEVGNRHRPEPHRRRHLCGADIAEPAAIHGSSAMSRGLKLTGSGAVRINSGWRNRHCRVTSRASLS